MTLNPATRRNILAGWVSGFLVALLLWLGVLQRPEDFLYDLLFPARSAPHPSGDVITVGIDQKSLDALGRFPWPRRTHARLVEQLHGMGARLIAFDLIFSEPTPEDEDLARAMREAGNVYLVVIREQKGKEIGYLSPAPLLAQAAAGLGHAHLSLSSDGVVRSAPLMVGPYPALSWLLAQAAHPAAVTNIPTDAGGQMRINFAPPNSIPVYSYVDVLNGLVPEEAIAGKIILVGFMAGGLADQHPIPSTVQREPIYGVTVLANALLTLLQGRFIQPVGTLRHPLFLIPALGIWGWLIGRWSAYRRILALALLSGGVLLVSSLLMRTGFYVSPLPVLVGGLGVFLIIAYLDSQEIERLVSAHLQRLPTLLSPSIPNIVPMPEDQQIVSGVQALLAPAGVALIEQTGPSTYILKAAKGWPETAPTRFRRKGESLSSLDWWRRVGLAGWIQESRISSVQAIPMFGETQGCPMPARRLLRRWLVLFRTQDSLVYPDDNALLASLVTMIRSFPCIADRSGALKGDAARLQTLTEIQNRLIYQLGVLATTGESISDGIVACDLWWRTYFCNRAMERVGIRPEDWQGKDFRLLMARLGIIALGEPLLTDLMRGKISSWQEEFRTSSDDRPIYWSVTISRVLSPQEQPLGLVARFADITKMRELDQTRADTIAFLAHEVRNPVAAIKGYAHLLRTIPQNHDVLAQRIDCLADHVARLVNNFLELTKFEANKIPIRPQPLSLATAIADAWKVVKPKAREKNIRFSVRGTRITVLADSRAMAQILINLLDNAVKYSRSGGSVQVSVTQKDEFAFVDITDNGIGIPESELPRLFTKFFRAPNAVATERGTGLGLVVVKTLVEAQGGKIFVQTKEGEGSTFTISLPLAPSPK